MDPRRSRFSPYVPGVNNNNTTAMRQAFRGQSDFPERDGRNEPRRTSGGGGGGGPVLRPKGAYMRPPPQHQQQAFPQQQFHYQQQQQQQQQSFTGHFNTRENRYEYNTSINYRHQQPPISQPSSFNSQGNRRENSRWDTGRNGDGNNHVNHTAKKSLSPPRLPAHIEERLLRERPCRTLFVRNIQYEANTDEIRSVFSKFGDIKDVFDLIEGRGMVFVSYYDIRSAESAKKATQGMHLSNRRIDVHYSLPKEEEEKSRCDRTKNQGTLLFTLTNTNEWLEDDELYHFLAPFGEIKEIRTPHFRNQSETSLRRQRLVEFYDSRACVSAYDHCQGKDYKNGVWDVSFFWDHSSREKEGHKKHDRGGPEYKRNNQRRSSDASTGNRRGDRFLTPSRHSDRYHDNTGDSAVRKSGSYDSRQPPPATVATGAGSVSMMAQGNSFEDTQRLEQAQKAQKLLTMMAHTSSSAQETLYTDVRPQPAPSPHPPQSHIASTAGVTLVSPYQAQPPQQQQQSLPVLQALVAAPPSITQQSPASQIPATQLPATQLPATQLSAPQQPDQASQIQQLLGLLTQVAQQQQQRQQQQIYQPAPPPPQTVQQYQSQQPQFQPQQVLACPPHLPAALSQYSPSLPTSRAGGDISVSGLAPPAPQLTSCPPSTMPSASAQQQMPAPAAALATPPAIASSASAAITTTAGAATSGFTSTGPASALNQLAQILQSQQQSYSQQQPLPPTSSSGNEYTNYHPYGN